ncbi:MAG TPA: hypothetical protein VF219_18005 [Vicinamibacterales bacterium]
MRFRSFGLLLLAGIGCTTPVYVARYDIELSSVTRADGGVESARFTDLHGHTFQDDVIKTTWTPYDKQLGLILTNNTDHIQRVLWPQVRYVDATGKAERVVHEGTTEIEPRKTILELIEPAGHLPAGSNRQEAPLIAYTYGYSERDVRSKMTRGTITVLLPIEGDGLTREYTFRFSVTGTVVRRGWSS